MTVSMLNQFGFNFPVTNVKKRCDKCQGLKNYICNIVFKFWLPRK